MSDEKFMRMAALLVARLRMTGEKFTNAEFVRHEIAAEIERAVAEALAERGSHNATS